MKKNFTLFIRRLSFLLLFSIVAVAAMSETPAYKPYPVYFPLADYPEFEYGTKLASFNDQRNSGANKIYSMSWSSGGTANNNTGENNTPFWYNCITGNYRKAPLTSPNSAAFPAGRALSLTCGSNRTRFISFKTPYINPGTYRIYMSVAFDNGGTTRDGGQVYRIKFDNQLIQMSDSLLNNRKLVNSVLLTGGNKQSVKFTGTGNKNYDAFLGTVTIPADSAKRHELSFNLTNISGGAYAFSMLQFIPVTSTNLDADYEYPKFDCAGNTFFLADSLKTVNNVAVSGYFLPYQAEDTTVYTKYDVNLDAGMYFANKMIVVKRADDKWTRLYSGTTDATGKVTAKLPVGSYLIEINKAVYSKTITVTEASTFNVGVSTGTVKVQYSPESWYVGKQFKVYNSGETVLLYDFTIPADGIVPDFALPVDAVNSYKYYVKNIDGTTFDAGSVSVANTSDITLNLQQVKYDVSIKLGNDAFGNSQDFTVARASNANALYVSNISSVTGTFDTQLPNGTYYLVTKSGYIFTTFIVKDAAKVVDITARYTANFCLGKTVAGARINVYLASTKALLNTLTVGADGKVALPGMTNGRYYHNVYKVNGTDTTMLVKKFTFMIEGADFLLGDASNLEQPYYLPYKVYFDICNQPEIKWRVDNGKSYTSGQLSRIKFDNVPVDTIFNVKDTTWIYTQGTTKIDTTFKVNFDSTSIQSITYFNWNTYYGFNGLTPSATADNYYIWGDQFNFRLAPKSKLTFVTPILNPGRYNVYMSNRWKANMGTPDIDTTYMDGKPLLITDGKKRTFKGGVDATTSRVFVANGKQQGLHLGEALVTKHGEHELSLYSLVGSTGAIGQESQVWANMIYFIPVDQDSVGINVTYYPRIDYTGRIIYRNASEGPTAAQTNMGTDGVNRPKYFSQFADPSIFASADVDYSKKLTVNGGIYSRGDVLTTVSPIDNWTTKAANADTLGTAIVTINPLTKAYAWAMDKEGVYGTAVVNTDKTITIPTVINTVIESSYSITPNVDDETQGTYTIISKVKTEQNLPFFYPINGVVFYTKNSDIIKAAGDTIYKPKVDSLNGIVPTLSTDLPILPYVLGSIYTGNGARLQSANGSVVTVKQIKAAAGGIYPNPARETMNLKLNENAGVASFAIYNQLGQVVRRGSFTGTEHSASLNGVSKGMYIVSVKVNGKNWNTKLIVE
jgi:hypothetical protein